MLLLGILLGLSSQGFARETTPCKEMARGEMTAMHSIAGTGEMPGCAEMQHAGKGKTPSKNLSLCCFAMANSSVGIAADAEPPLGAAILPPALAANWPVMRVLHGREIAPDPDPPSFSG
ncbi:MAG: hypothetical protein ACKVOL_08770 [Novosphingobium sp.]